MDAPVWCHLRELRELGYAERLFVEDDARPPDAETIGQAFFRLFGRELPNWNSHEWTHQWDGGDAFYAFNQPNRIVVCWSACHDSDIHRLLPGLADFKRILEPWDKASEERQNYDARRAYSRCANDLRHFVGVK